MELIPAKSISSPHYSALSAAELLGLVQDFQQQLCAKESELQQRKSDIKQQKNYIALLEELLKLSKIQKFTASSEKHAHQIHLFDEAELETQIDDLRDQLPDTLEHEQLAPEPAREKRSTRKRGFSDKLIRQRIELLLREEQKVGADKVFFSKVKEELQYIPAQLKVLEYWQEKAVFSQPDGQEQIIAATRAAHPLGKCIATTSLLSYIITSKYADGLPLHRLEQMIKRLGHDLSRTNMANWVIRLDEVFRPLIHLMREVQNSSDYLQADETRIQVLKEDGKTAQSDKWMWVTRGGPPQRPSVLFDYDPSRAGSVAVRLLEDFTGVLQADGYSGYGKVCRDNAIRRIGCWDHARRKFIEASRAASSKNKGNKQTVSKADVALSHINKLYAIERQIKDLSDAERYHIRQTLSVPALESFKHWLLANAGKVMKGLLTRTAMDYTLNQWRYLIGYCARGDLQISNVLAENAIRPFALGRKAWLFADTKKGAQASATCYSLIETAKANDLEPSAYVHYVLDRIAEADTLEKLEQLLPWNVPLERVPKKVVQYA